MNQDRRIGLGLLATGVVGVLIVLMIVIAGRASALGYTIVFEDAKGLQRGDKVQLNGVDVGTVKSVTLVSSQPPRVEVVVRIDADQAEKIRSDSTAFISNVSLPNVSGQKVVEILNPTGGVAVTMKDGAEIRGMNSLIDLQLWKVKHKLGDAAAKISQELSEVKETVKKEAGPAGQRLREKGAQIADTLREKSAQWSSKIKDAGKQLKEGANDPKVRDLYTQVMDKLNQFIQLMREKGVSAFNEVQQRWQELKPEIIKLLDQLKELNQKYVVDTFKQVMAEIEQQLGNLRAQSPTPTPTPTAAEQDKNYL
ncbi:MlaD family protein [bacterium]|nr:MlaD family protein [bacterium]